MTASAATGNKHNTTLPSLPRPPGHAQKIGQYHLARNLTVKNPDSVRITNSI
jgi:hypothetical protein